MCFDALQHRLKHIFRYGQLVLLFVNNAIIITKRKMRITFYFMHIFMFMFILNLYLSSIQKSQDYSSIWEMKQCGLVDDYLRPWKRKQHVHTSRRYLCTRLHGVTCQKAEPSEHQPAYFTRQWPSVLAQCTTVTRRVTKRRTDLLTAAVTWYRKGNCTSNTTWLAT